MQSDAGTAIKDVSAGGDLDLKKRATIMLIPEIRLIRSVQESVIAARGRLESAIGPTLLMLATCVESMDSAKVCNFTLGDR
jgi:hypothetical protein